jgi:hypothetical protein
MNDTERRPVNATLVRADVEYLRELADEIDSDGEFGTSKNLRECADGYANALAEVERLSKECFALAANQCHDGYAGEHGHHRCREVERLRGLARRAEVVLGLFIDCESEGGIRREIRAALRSKP